MSIVDPSGAPATPPEEQAPTKKRIFIMIEETGQGKAFQVFMGGDINRLNDQKVDPKDYTPAEFWGKAIFGLAIAALKQAGVIKDQVNPQGMRQE